MRIYTLSSWLVPPESYQYPYLCYALICKLHNLVTLISLPAITTRPPFPSSSLTALMVMFKGSEPSQTFLSFKERMRSFSSASFALESNSRRKTSLFFSVSQWVSEPTRLLLTVESIDYTVRSSNIQRIFNTHSCEAPHLLMTILRSRATSLCSEEDRYQSSSLSSRELCVLDTRVFVLARPPN